METIRFEVDCDISEPHFHEELEMMYVLSGRVAVMNTGVNYVLGPEDFVVFNPFEYHEMYREEGNHTLSMFLPAELLRQTGVGYIRCCSCIQQEQTDYLYLLRSKMAVIFKNYMDVPDEQRLYILSQVIGLLAILKQQFEVTEKDGQEVVTDHSKIREVLLYLHNHFSEEISLQLIAEHTYLSKSYISRMFQKQTGTGFSEYLRKLRLNRAEFLLRTTDKSVTDIALDCGFSSTNTLIVNFKEMYHLTPGVYRRQHAGENIPAACRVNRDKASYLRLLKYAASEENIQPLNKQHIPPTRMKLDIRREQGKMTLCHRESISAGWAKSLLEEDVRNAVRRAVKEIGFRYVTFHGLLDDSLDVYHEDQEGNPWFSFTYIDQIVEFLLSAGLTPWIEFCFTPVKLRADADNMFGESYVQLPADLNKWSMLVGEVMKHLLDTYGAEEMRQWGFSILPAFYISYDVFTIEDYLAYYECTFRSIRDQYPEASIYGGSFDAGLMQLDTCGYFEQFLEFCMAQGCMPKALCFQSFCCDYSVRERKEVEEKIRTINIALGDEPAPPSADPDCLQKEIACIRSILTKYGIRDYPIRFDAWNSTIWQRDLGNDTCYKAAFIVKNFLENMGAAEALNYCHLTDNSEQRIHNSNLFHGGNGLLTYCGIPKASYYAYFLLNRLGSQLTAQGDGYVVTSSKDKKQVQIMLYHYCHYDMDAHISKAFQEDEQRTLDRYYEFADPGVRSFRLYLQGIEAGSYDKECYTLNRETGSSYDKWMEMGAPKLTNPEQRTILEKGSGMGYKIERLYVDDTGELLVSAVLDAHEVRVICISKR